MLLLAITILRASERETLKVKKVYHEGGDDALRDVFMGVVKRGEVLGRDSRAKVLPNESYSQTEATLCPDNHAPG